MFTPGILWPPLYWLARLLTKVRKGDFDPDSSRSGRWTSFPTEEHSLVCCFCPKPLAGSRVFFRDSGNWAHCAPPCCSTCASCSAEFCAVCDSLASHKCTKAAGVAPLLLAEDSLDDFDSDDDSDLEVARMNLEETQEVEQAEEDQLLFLKRGFSIGSDAAMPPEGVIVHKIHKTAHKVIGTLGECEAACGITVRDLVYDYTIDPEDLFECKLCWRAGCAPWAPTMTEVASSEGDNVEASLDSSLDFFESAAGSPTM